MKNPILLVLPMLCVLTGCGPSQSSLPEPRSAPELNETSMCSICELATLNAYYHNVAKLEKSPGHGLVHWLEKKRTLWVEYVGSAIIGIDWTKVQIEKNGDTQIITLPAAEILDIKVEEDTLSDESIVVSKDSINSNPITANNQTEAILAAQTAMQEAIQSDASLLLDAQNRAKILLENYLEEIGCAENIEWRYDELVLGGKENEK